MKSRKKCLSVAELAGRYGVFKYKNYEISVNFSSEHRRYIATYHYVCKEKAHHDIVPSLGHLNLIPIGSSPRTKNAMATYSANN